MLQRARAVYLATRKKHDQLFNTFVMRPLAAGVVAALGDTRVTPNQLTLLNLVLFVVGAALLVGLPSLAGGLVAVLVLELSYLFDCADGMLARHKKLASKAGHLFDFFTDEIKATLLVASLSLRLFRTGGFGLSAASLVEPWPPGDPRFLVLGITATFVVASAISLTNFVRRPELSGRETPVEAHYEAAARESPPPSSLRRALGLAGTFLRFLNHYPSHLYVFAALGRFDAYLWLYLTLNAAYLARGWLGLFVRFGRFA